MSKPLQGEIALVTGASRGIGAAIADLLAAQGATVIGTATSASGAQAIGERLAGMGGHGRELNVTDAAAVDALIDAIGKEFGGISILVNNAGITRDNLLMRMKDEDWQAIIDTNLTSVYRTSKAVMRGMMKARKGRIINIASVIGVTGNAGQANYAAAKAGIIAFSKSLAKEIGSRGGRASTINSIGSTSASNTCRQITSRSTISLIVQRPPGASKRRSAAFSFVPHSASGTTNPIRPAPSPQRFGWRHQTVSAR